MANPFIVGEHIYLSPVTKKSIPAYLRWRNNPLIREQLLVTYPENELISEEFIEMVTESNRYVIFDIYFSPNHTHIGNCGLSHIDYIHRNAEFGIMVGEPEYQNRGLGTEATAFTVDYAFNVLNLHKIYLRVFETNEMAKRVYEKVGFSTEGILREQFFIGGRYIDAYLMSLLRDDFAGIQ